MTAPDWRTCAQSDAETIVRVLTNAKDSQVTREDISLLKESMDSLRRNVLAMEAVLEVGA